MAPTDDYEKATQTFLSWLTQMGIKLNPKMALADLRSESRGRGVVALEDFEEDEVIFTIPRPSILNVKTANPSLNPRIDLSTLPSWLSLTTIILSESRQPDSKWGPYFAVLPHHLDSLVFWSDAELAELQASAVTNRISKNAAEELFSQSLVPLGFDIDISHRVASTIMAYAFDIPEEEESKEEQKHVGEDEGDLVSDDGQDERTILSMVPLADMLNADADRNNARLFYDAADLEMRAIKPIHKGEEIFNDYGQLPRSDLLRRYGYVTDNYAIYDVAELPTQTILDFFTKDSPQLADLTLPSLDEKQLKQRIELAEREGVYEDSYDIFHAHSDEPPYSDELLALLYILLVDKETLGSMLNSRSSLPSRSKLTTQLLGRVLSHILRDRELQYSTTLEEDDALSKRNDLPHRQRLAIQVRHGEKEVLRKASLEALEFQGSDKRMRVAQAAHNEHTGKRKAENQTVTSKKQRHR